MASTAAKTIVATGATSGLGFEAARQLLAQTEQPYRLIVGARDTAGAQAAYDALGFDSGLHRLTVLPLELSDLRAVRAFAHRALEELGPDRLDILLLNAAAAWDAQQPAAGPSVWCGSYVVNHLSQHYLTHLLREKLAASKSRIVVVSSGAIRRVSDPSTLDDSLKLGSGANNYVTYCNTKFAQLLGAHWWKRQLTGVCPVVAVSPGLVPGTGIFRGSDIKLSNDMPDAKPVPEGAASILRAFTRDDFPDDPDLLFLTSWGEWWDRQTIEKSLDKGLQDKWSPSLEQIEKEAGLEKL